MRYTYDNALYHYGILGQKWGIRRFQNPDGTLTEAGKRRYGNVENLEAGRTKRQAARFEKAKKAAIRSGSVEEVSKYSKALTAEEFNEAVRQIDMAHKLKTLRNDEIIDGTKRVGAIVGRVESLAAAYNFTAKVVNAASGKQKLSLVKDWSASDLEKLYKLEQQKKKDKEDEKFEKLLKDKDINDLVKNANKYSTKQIQDLLKRKSALEGIDNDKFEDLLKTKSIGDLAKNAEKYSTKNITKITERQKALNDLDKAVSKDGSSSGKNKDASTSTSSAKSETPHSESSGTKNTSYSEPSQIRRDSGSKKSPIDSINKAYDKVSDWGKTVASKTSKTFESAMKSGDDWVRKTYGSPSKTQTDSTKSESTKKSTTKSRASYESSGSSWFKKMSASTSKTSKSGSSSSNWQNRSLYDLIKDDLKSYNKGKKVTAEYVGQAPKKSTGPVIDMELRDGKWQRAN